MWIGEGCQIQQRRYDRLAVHVVDALRGVVREVGRATRALSVQRFAFSRTPSMKMSWSLL